MSGYNKFDAECYSEELFSDTEVEHDEMMGLIAEEGYQEWSEELEAKLEAEAWHDAKNVFGVLIKKACEHSECPNFRCERGLRMGGFQL